MTAASGPAVHELRTPRLHLRRWRDTDRAPFAALNADPRVMEHFPSALSREESDRVAARIDAGIATRGFGLWAVEVPGVTAFAGFVGLSVPGFEAPFTPCVEIGWRLAVEHWGHGYATEGARATLAFAWETLKLDGVVAFTAVDNIRSRRVMARLGMRRDPAEDFDLPEIPADHPLRRHVLYRIARPAPC